MRFLYPLAIVIPLAIILRMGCVAHGPMIVENDTSQVVLMYRSSPYYPGPVRLSRIELGTNSIGRGCWGKNDALLLASKQYPDPIVFARKDFCDGSCKCDFPVSKLLKQMTPSFVLKRQQEVCSGGGPLLEPDVRSQLCLAYIARSTGNALSSGTDPAMLRE